MIREEDDIIQGWNQNLPLVSISCVAYNHENFIEECLDSFLNQDSVYPFEILIHDDASIDNTSKIIKTYVNRYPRIIFPIFQKINQYSKNVKPNLLNIERAKGKYIAFCDGDDYWSSKKKISKQVKYMEEYTKCDVSFHGVTVLYSDNSTENRLKNTKPHIYTLNEIILKDYHLVFSSSSIMIKREILKNIPEFYKIAPVEDYYLRIIGSINGGGLYIPEILSTYRRLTPNSFTKLNKRSSNVALKNYLAMKELKKNLNHSIISITSYKLLLFLLKYIILRIINLSKN